MGLTDKLGEYKVQLEQFSSNQYVQGSKNFLQSNSIVAKFAFLILVLIIFMMLLSLGSFILTRVFSKDSNPILIDGMINCSILPDIFVIEHGHTKTDVICDEKQLLNNKYKLDYISFVNSFYIKI